VKGLLAVAHVFDAITEFFGKLALWIVPIVIFVGSLNVVLRKLGEPLQSDLYGRITEALTGRAVSQNQVTEVQWYLFSLLFFFSFAYILKHGVNVRVDFLYSKWSSKHKALVDLLGTLLFLIPFCVLGIYVTVAPVAFSWGCVSSASQDSIMSFLGNLTCAGEPEIGPDPGSLPRNWIKSFIIVAFVLLLLQAFSQTIKYLAVLAGRDDVDKAMRSEVGPAFDVEEVQERVRATQGAGN
jgi:TRAP-type mannitol/chloroaromatic compound transport system permease small subunit